ncbi:hypothetical protein SDC9_205166 [bioreactor metagenome]|uniref:Uncharacterized protein n=1 Tax=bioreactor metagenome TaxID=1076179 RepID=A0A645J2Y2_9ZZZZ
MLNLVLVQLEYGEINLAMLLDQIQEVKKVIQIILQIQELG